MRIQAIQQSMAELGVRRFLISDPKAIEYVLGKRFHVSERFLACLFQDDEVVLFLNQLFPYVDDRIEIVRFHDIDDPTLLLTKRLTGHDLSIDRQFASGFLLKCLKHRPELDVRDGSFIVDRIRAKKSKEEQAKMRLASQINDTVMGEVVDRLKVGVSEVEIAAFIRQRFLEVADGVSFDPIVAFGSATADPHAQCEDRRLEEGMPIIIDMGCVKDGYCSDMTRSFSLGKPWNQEIYDTVKEANLAGIKAVKPGVKLSEIDTAARKVIEDKGYGAYFIHRLGHGIGTDVHEPFDVSGVSDIVAFEGMVFSIEPGIYLEGQGGVRIEDLVLVTADGCEVLNAYPKSNEVLP